MLSILLLNTSLPSIQMKLCLNSSKIVKKLIACESYFFDLDVFFKDWYHLLIKFWLESGGYREKFKRFFFYSKILILGELGLTHENFMVKKTIKR